MKTTSKIIPFFFVLLFTTSVFAQRTENQLFYAYKHTVKPEKIEEYKELMSKFASACREHNYPVSFSGWQSLSPNFYYFYRVKDYNTADQLGEEAWKIIPKMESGYAKKLFETVESWESFFVRSIDSLSYNPENSLAAGVELPYAEWWIDYHQTWTGGKYRKTFRKAVKMQKESNFDYPVSRLLPETGMNGPAIISVFWGKNPADLYAHMQKNWDNLSEEVQSMINDFPSTTRKFEKIPFWYQPDMSYSPE